MTDKNIYVNDLIHRFASHTFTETTVNSITKIEFKNASLVVIGEAQKLNVIDAYRAIRNDLLGAEVPLFLSDTTQRDALTNVDNGTTIYNITTDEDETWNGTLWRAAGGETGGLVHLPLGMVSTTDNTQTTVKSVTIPVSTLFQLTAEVDAELVDHTVAAVFTIKVGAKRLATGGALLVGTPTITHQGKDAGAANWSVTFTVSGNNVRVSVTGANTTNINWDADLHYLKI